MIDILIIEDEAHAAEKLQRLIEEIDPGCNIRSIIPTVKEAVEFFRNNSVDLVFLDIQLLDGKSFEIFEQVEINTPVIFTTAYNQFAIDAFKLNSVDYLLKPIRKDELTNSIAKYRQTRLGNTEKLHEILKQINDEKPAWKTRFLIQYGQKMKMVETSHIAYFFASQKAVFLRTFEGTDYPLDQSLESLGNIVDPEKFRQINRKMIVNIEAIKDMHVLSRSRLKLQLTPLFEDSSAAIVSIERAKGFKQWLEGGTV